LHREYCKKYKIPLKRGILLSGTYGTGKTLVSYATARLCLEQGWTFLMTERADELVNMIDFAKQYQPAVVFCEDIDRVVAGERSVDMDEILNIIDGVESKNTEIMIVLTTNHVEKIHRAMLRPGRLDAVINVLPPDAQAVEKLIRLYGRGLVPVSEDLTAVGEALAGEIPAVIRECIERAKLYAISDGSLNGNQITITGDNLLTASKSMRSQLELLRDKKELTKTPEVLFGESLSECIQKNVIESNKTLAKDVANRVQEML
jgi:transitional endoplasmic reticulum ATPase